MRHREGNDTPFRHSEAVTDVTAVGIFLYRLPRLSNPGIASHREGHFHLERVCSTVAPYTRGTLPTIFPESKI